MSRYVTSPEAKEDLKLIREYLITQGGKPLARNVLRQISAAIQLLTDNPSIGHAAQTLPKSR